MIKGEPQAHQKEVDDERAQRENGDDVKNAQAVSQRQAIGKAIVQRAVHHEYRAAQPELELRQNGNSLLRHLKLFLQLVHVPLFCISV